MADSALLEAFPNPTDGAYVIEHVATEFTSLCPKTGHPDFGVVTLRYEPLPAGRGGTCVELKSLKLYIWSFRDEGAFHEAVTNRILDDLVAACEPHFIRLSAEFNVRGGVYTTVVAEHRSETWVPPSPVSLP